MLQVAIVKCAALMAKKGVADAAILEDVLPRHVVETLKAGRKGATRVPDHSHARSPLGEDEG